MIKLCLNVGFSNVSFLLFLLLKVFAVFYSNFTDLLENCQLEDSLGKLCFCNGLEEKQFLLRYCEM